MKNKFMQTIVGTFLGLLILVSVTQIFVFGQENKTHGQQGQNLVGVWQSVVTPRNCQTGDPMGPAFQGLLTFNEGGTLAEFGAGSIPGFRGPGHGIWEAGNQFHPTFASTFMRLNPDGTFAGRTTFRSTITLGQGGNEFTTTGTAEFFAPNGTLIGMGCATSTSTRFQ